MALACIGLRRHVIQAAHLHAHLACVIAGPDHESSFSLNRSSFCVRSPIPVSPVQRIQVVVVRQYVNFAVLELLKRPAQTSKVSRAKLFVSVVAWQPEQVVCHPTTVSIEAAWIESIEEFQVLVALVLQTGDKLRQRLVVGAEEV